MDMNRQQEYAQREARLIEANGGIKLTVVKKKTGVERYIAIQERCAHMIQLAGGLK